MKLPCVVGSPISLSLLCFFAAQLERNFYEDEEEISYTWVREYHWDVRPRNVSVLNLP